MTLRARRLFYLSFIIIFLVIAPILILYTTGYRYNLQKKKVEQIGVLFADVKPAEANLKINNTLLPTTRPLRLSDLKPNFYLLQAYKEGYFTWQKNLEIKSKESTLVYDIVLFKQNTLTILERGLINFLSLSPKNETLVYLSNNLTYLQDLKTGQIKKLDTPPLSFLEPNLSWSPNGKFLLISERQDSQSAFVVETTGEEKIYKLNGFIKEKLDQLSWHANSQNLLGVQNGSLVEIDFIGKTTTYLAQQIKTYAVTNGEIYLTKNFSDKTIIYLYNKFNIFNPLEEIAILPLEIYEIVEEKNNFLSLHDSHNQIYLIDLSDDRQPLLRLNGQLAIWGQGSKNNFLYYYDRSEIWIFDPKTKKSYMLNRYDENVTKVLPLYNIPYFLIQTNNQLTLGELDDRDKRQFFPIYEGKQINNVLVDKTGKQIYLIDKIKNEDTVLQLKIQ